RELGRGGMGVVYEAEQISLGRRVALKTMTFAGALDPRQLVRFENEARAAALLNHPNIIPVYSVGIDQGIHYFAMRLVDGFDLRNVIRNVFGNRLKIDPHEITKPATAETLDIAGSVDFIYQNCDRPAGNGARADSLPDHPDTTILADFSSGDVTTEQDYVRWVAKIATQAAEALNAAHEHGVLHRDVKPSNLMLERSGRLWVMDFGLARLEAGADMTATGDVLGTLRYSSPEQALGKRGLVDHRSDIYSLGATLYELLTGVPLFGDSDRGDLVANIAHDDPLAPRKINRSIPADLETIVLKSISKEAAMRYETAQHLADDLRCFLDEKPVQATRPSIWNRMVKWSKRNKPWAAAIGTVIVAMVTLMAGLVVHSRSLSDFNRQLDASNQDLEQLLYAADIQLADNAYRKRDPRQVIDILNRYIPQPGEPDPRGLEWYYLQRQVSGMETVLADYEKAAYALAFSKDGQWLATGGEESILRVYNTATLEETTQFDTGQGEINGVAFSPDNETLATTGDDGTVRLWEWQRKRLTQKITALADEVYQIQFTPDGKRLVITGIDPAIRVWDIGTSKLHGLLEGHTDTAGAADISPNGRLLASASYDSTVRLWDLESMQQVRIVRQNFNTKLVCVQFSKDGRRLASGSRQGRMTIHEVASGKLLFEGAHHDGVQSVAFSPDGRQLASADRGGVISIWKLPADDDGVPLILQPEQKLSAHEGRAYRIAYATDGRHLATAGSDGVINWLIPKRQSVWQTISGDGGIGYAVCFTKTGRSLFTCNEAAVFVNDFATLRTERVFARSTAALSAMALSPDSKNLVLGHFNGGLQLFDVATGREIQRGHLELGSGLAVLTYSPDRRFVSVESSGTTTLIDPSSLEIQPFDVAVEGYHPNFSPDGSLLFVADNDNIHVWDTSQRHKINTIEHAHSNGVKFLAASPDGRVLASGGGDRQVRLWDTGTGQKLATLATHEDHVETLGFSPDGRTLLSGDLSGTMVAWQVATGQKLIEFDKFPSGIRSIQFSPDGESIVCRLFNLQILVLKLREHASMPEESLIDESVPDSFPTSEAEGARTDKTSPQPANGKEVLVAKQVSMTRPDRPHEMVQVRLLRNGKLEFKESVQRIRLGLHTWAPINESREGLAGDLENAVQFDVCGFAGAGDNNRVWLFVVTREGKVWGTTSNFPQSSWRPFEVLWKPSGISDHALRVTCEAIDAGHDIEITVTTRDGKQHRTRRDQLLGWSKFNLVSNSAYPFCFSQNSTIDPLRSLATRVRIDESGEVLGKTQLASAAPDGVDITPGFVGRARLAAIEQGGSICFLSGEHAQSLAAALEGRTTQVISFTWKDQIPADALQAARGFVLVQYIDPLDDDGVRRRIAE
ncbi:WD40 repeat domain-containing serine/threonine protein kinase, partial [Symmachiella dynata]|uniref:WD40 repeat domain-containing serine/threonine protein kinase n=1 Tax=Symmachiella dynata TaxID=2527995 RepID=UPI0030EC8F88